MRNVVVFDVFEERRQRHHALGRGLADHDRGVAGRQGGKGVVLELYRARRVEERPLVAEIIDGSDVQLGAHAALARLGRTVAYGGACARGPAPADGPRGVEEALEQGRLAREIRPAQRHHAMRAATWSAPSNGLGFDVVHDNVLPFCADGLRGEAPDVVVAPELSGRSDAFVEEMLSLRAGGVNRPVPRIAARA